MPDTEPSEPVTDTAAPTGKAVLWFLASLPPPIDGQKICNAAMLARLSECAAPVQLSLGRTTMGKILRACSNGWTLLRRVRSGDIAYISIPGQMGAWMLLPVVAALRLRGVQTWFHHHSFRPINRGPLKVMQVLVACAGPRQNHILLSDGMRNRFGVMYLNSGKGRVRTLSNTYLFPPETHVQPPPRPERPPTLGHLSVLTRAKGVFHLIDLFDDLATRIPGIRLILAGPTQDRELAGAIAAAEMRHPGAIEYRGPISGTEKARFYRDIDLFVLPTTLVDEAEPLVIIEAYAQGVDVFATATGCIPDRLRASNRTLTMDRIEDAEMIHRAATMTLAEWTALRRACHLHVVQLATVNAAQGKSLFLQMCTEGSWQREADAVEIAA